MHEASLVAALCQEVKSLGQKEGALKATRITVSIGELAGVEVEAFSLAFKAYQESDPFFAQTKLEIETIPAQRRCFSCGKEFSTPPPCPYCGSLTTLPLCGEELELTRIEFLLPDTN